MSTNLAPNTVDDAMSTFTLDGMRCSCDGSIARCSAALPSGRLSIESTLPTCDATHLDLGVGVHHQAGAIRNDRHWYGFGEAAPEQADGQGDDHARSRRSSPSPSAGVRALRFIGVPLSRQVEVAVGTVDGQRHQQGDRRRPRSARCAPRCPRRRPTPEGPPEAKYPKYVCTNKIVTAISIACRNDHNKSTGLRKVLK